MYSIILAAMLSGTADQTQAWHRNGCRGGSCVGSCVGSCYGSCVGSCYGSCSGSCSGSCHGSWGHGLFHHGHGCSGSSCFGSSCSGSSCSGGYANYGCNGFTGYIVGYSNWASGCYGSSCFGGCYGCTGGIGCFGWTGGVGESQGGIPVPTFSSVETGGVVISSTPVPSSKASTPAVGGTTPAPVVPGAAPVVPAPVVPAPAVPAAAPKADAPSDLPKLPTAPELKTPMNMVSATNAARVTIYVPADAKLWVDTVECPLTGTVRSFSTPALAPGAQYAYTITVEMPNGQRDDRRITMTAGRNVDVDFRTMAVETVQR